MNRTIMFRGKRMDNGEWVCGSLVTLKHNDDNSHLHYFILPLEYAIENPPPVEQLLIEVDPATVGQYTGLHDKNGKEIYEGDVIQDHIGIGFVEWVMEHSAFIVEEVDNGSVISYNRIESDGTLKHSEIIGNIYDNPELMEVTHD